MNGDKTRLAELTGLRGIASLLVVATHAAYWTGHYTPDTTGLFWTRLDFGVALFFALSGFLLVRPWIDHLATGRAEPSLRHYATRRFWRVVPGYWIIVLAAFTLHDAPRVNGFGEFLRHLGFAQIYGDGHLRSGLTQTWSLATELAFYLALPLIGWVIVRFVCRGAWRPAPILTALGTLAAANVGYLVFVQSSPITVSSQMWLPAFLTWFVGGMGLYVVLVACREGRPWARRWLSWPAEAPLTVLAIALTLFLVTCTPLAGEPSMYQTTPGAAVFRNLAYATVATLILSVLVVDRPNPARAAMARLAPLGEISYEIFLVHVLVLEYVMHMLDQMIFSGNLMLTFAITVALSVPPAWALKWVTDRLAARAAPRRAAKPV